MLTVHMCSTPKREDVFPRSPGPLLTLGPKCDTGGVRWERMSSVRWETPRWGAARREAPSRITRCQFLLLLVR
ncbi:hypothetical protein EYF80_027326 [Liparis tanakae]|uniref:Uncharacterized protein n=1 Tax=Liparis tanakae TaxID=230148 RepID=A0A4Z2H958_9TELE|nr:hypothetical protein EYF80_027326 [Liparis tanakae]